MSKIELLYSAMLENDGRMLGHCEIRPSTPELEAVINVIASYPGGLDSGRIEAAVRRRGYSNSDGGFGVQYPDDLDEYEKANGSDIPAGCVRVYTFFGPPAGGEFTIQESLYLEVLELWLFMRGVKHDAIKALRETMDSL